MLRAVRTLSRSTSAARARWPRSLGAHALPRRGAALRAHGAQRVQGAPELAQAQLLRSVRMRSHSCSIAARTSATSGPVTRTAKSSRGAGSAPWLGSWRSSRMLMPPQNATRPSTTHSLRCRRRQLPGHSTPSRPGGA